MITLEQQLAEAQRELALRKRVYPWDPELALRRILIQEAIVQTLTELCDLHAQPCAQLPVLEEAAP